MTNLPKIDAFKPRVAGSLRGFCDVTLPSGMRLFGCTLFVGSKGPWVSPPSKPMIGRDGTVMKDHGGKTQYQPCVSFATREAQDRFSKQVVEALRAQFPEALA